VAAAAVVDKTTAYPQARAEGAAAVMAAQHRLLLALAVMLAMRTPLAAVAGVTAEIMSILALASKEQFL
jgi:hypothetical protein